MRLRSLRPFYQSCLDGELEITLLRDTSLNDQPPASLRDKVACAHLRSGLVEVAATDWQHLLHEVCELPFGIYGHLADRGGSQCVVIGEN